MRIRSKTFLAGLVVVLASTIPGSAATLHVPVDYSTIQAAVDAAASNDVIRIAPGVYTNQVVITDKNLTLSGPGAVLRATPGMQQSLAPYSFFTPLLGIFESEVVVSGLTLEGERLADSPTSDFVGIYFLSASGRVEDCRITGFRGSMLGTSDQWAEGVRAVNPQSLGAGPVDIQVLRSTFADNVVSIELVGDAGPGFDPTLLRTTFTVSDNTIVGNGPDATGRQLGINIFAGTSGEVKRNTITDHAYTGTTDPTPFSFGISAVDNNDYLKTNALAALHPVHFEGNILRNNQIDLLLVRGDGSTVVNNSFEGTGPGYRHAGLGLSGENLLVATNRFSDMETGTGIVLFGNDPEFGTYLGIASNAVLVANGFCNVATNYLFEPLTTYDLQSTLMCPPPILDIQAVRLSWPFSYTGYSVETASSPDGPWAPSDATPFLQDGQNRVIIPTEGDQQFFRLVRP